MNDVSRQSYWENVYATKRENEVSWFQETPALSLELIRLVGAIQTSAIIDIGGGASRLADCLVSQSYQDVTVLDLSATALASARARIGDATLPRDVTRFARENHTKTQGMVDARGRHAPVLIYHGIGDVGAEAGIDLMYFLVARAKQHGNGLVAALQMTAQQDAVDSTADGRVDLLDLLELPPKIGIPGAQHYLGCHPHLQSL